MTTSVEPITSDQISELISSIDPDKVLEIEAMQRYAAISVKLRAGSINGHLICLWGLIPPTLCSDRAYLWLYTTEAAQEHEFILVRRSQIEVQEMLEEYPLIVGHCEISETRSIRWLRWLGAKFGDHEGTLVPFMIERKG